MRQSLSESNVPAKKSVFEYSNYREYIRDYYLYSKAENKKFSHRMFARLAGFKSSNFIKFVIDGKSNVSHESAMALAQAMKMTKAETQFFVTLAMLNQASSSEDRHRYAEELMSYRTHRKIYPLREALFNYTSKWYLSILRGMVGLPGFREDIPWIAKHFLSEVTQSEIQRGFEDLIALGLLKRDENGKLQQVAANVASDDEVALSSVAQFHREMMQKASESIDNVPREERDISGMTIGVSAEMAKKIKEMIQNFRKELIDVVNQDQKTTKVYQLNIQLFPLFDSDDEGDGGTKP